MLPFGRRTEHERVTGLILQASGAPNSLDGNRLTDPRFVLIDAFDALDLALPRAARVKSFVFHSPVRVAK